MADAAESAGTAGAVPSPCVDVCRMNARSGLCDGCWRRIDEIVAWSGLDDAARRAVWRAIEQRRADAALPSPARRVDKP